MSTTPRKQVHVPGVSAASIASGAVPVDILQRPKEDRHARYRRPAFNPDGTRALDAAGAPAWDEITYPIRRHFDAMAKGFELFELVAEDGAPEAVVVEIPEAIADLAALGRRGQFTKGEMSATFPLSEFRALTSKGWTFVQLEDAERAKLIAEGKLPSDGRSVEDAARVPVLPIAIEPRA